MCCCKKKIEKLASEVEALKNELAMVRLALANVRPPEVVTATASSAEAVTVSEAVLRAGAIKRLQTRGE